MQSSLNYNISFSTRGSNSSDGIILMVKEKQGQKHSTDQSHSPKALALLSILGMFLNETDKSELANKSELKESTMIYFKAVNSGKLNKYFNDV